MKKILAVTAIVTLVFGNAVYANKTRYKYEARRTVEAGFQVDATGHYVSPESRIDRSMKEACQEAVDICEESENVECATFRPTVKYKDSGYGVSGAEITCAADTIDVLNQIGQSRSWTGLFSK